MKGFKDPGFQDRVAAAAKAGAGQAGYTLLRLPYEIKDLFGAWLDSPALPPLPR
mgnify:CR=1 FL=1